MPIPLNLTRADIITATKQIMGTDIPRERLSTSYELVHEGISLPPKYVISIANQLTNGYPLDAGEFNSIEAIAYLKKLGFEARKIGRNRDGSLKRYWIEKSLVERRPDRIEGDRAVGKVLWSPQKDKRGSDIYKNMRAVQKNDVVLHLTDNSAITGVSIATSEYEESTGVLGTAWEGPAYLVQLKEYTKIDPPLYTNEVFERHNKEVLIDIERTNEVFYTSELKLRQGAYLTPASPQLIQLINTSYKVKTGQGLPHVTIHQSDLLKNTNSVKFDPDSFLDYLIKLGHVHSDLLCERFIASLWTKHFVILTGLSGSGKTKLAITFAKWICRVPEQYCLVPVGADWTNRDPLFGYVNALSDPPKYEKPANGVVQLIHRAAQYRSEPHFLILDEMNLSHVERYFADFLSVMESKGDFTFHSFDKPLDNVEPSVKLPQNLFIIGTVNIDETTYMFSPKVLDRANVIEFRIAGTEMSKYLGSYFGEPSEEIEGKGADMGSSFVELATQKQFINNDSSELAKRMIEFFDHLMEVGAEYGYRTANEIVRWSGVADALETGWDLDQKMDLALMQKLLPKLHGSRKKLKGPLEEIAKLCFHESRRNNVIQILDAKPVKTSHEGCRYPTSFEKIHRMYRNLLANGFTSYAEA